MLEIPKNLFSTEVVCIIDIEQFNLSLSVDCINDRAIDVSVSEQTYIVETDMLKEFTSKLDAYGLFYEVL